MREQEVRDAIICLEGVNKDIANLMRGFQKYPRYASIAPFFEVAIRSVDEFRAELSTLPPGLTKTPDRVEEPADPIDVTMALVDEILAEEVTSAPESIRRHALAAAVGGALVLCSIDFEAALPYFARCGRLSDDGVVLLVSGARCGVRMYGGYAMQQVGEFLANLSPVDAELRERILALPLGSSGEFDAARSAMRTGLLRDDG